MRRHRHLRAAVWIAMALPAAAGLAGCEKASKAREVTGESISGGPSPRPPSAYSSPGASIVTAGADNGQTGNVPGQSNTSPAQPGNMFGVGPKPLPPPARFP